MYRYTEADRAFLAERLAQFRAQVARRLDGSLTEEEFKPLRLMNGLYLQLHAYMLRVAIPYGTLAPDQLRRLAMVAERWDRGYGHFTTRQNIQFNWPALADVPEMLEALAEVDMHAVQTSGNTIRNVTADAFAGAAADEVADPRPHAELIRQWSTDHPEFQFLPRKFKIAISGGAEDRAVTRAHDIGLRLLRRDGALGFEVLVGGGLGRTPMIGKVIRDFLPEAELLPYLEAIVHVYNRLGRRDNKFKARIKIAVHEIGLERIRDEVEAVFIQTRGTFPGAGRALDRIAADFAPPAFAAGGESPAGAPAFRAWADTNLRPHHRADHAIAIVSLKPHGGVPGDATADQMRALADLADRFGYGEIRVSHRQNLVLPHVRKADLADLHAGLLAAGLATANAGLASDIIACPGMDYCALATARSIPVAQDIARRLEEIRIERAVGPLSIKISGCINACGHHHVGDIGILGLDRAGVESYQITLGGAAGRAAAIGARTGPGFAHDAVVPAVERVLETYLAMRHEGETFAAAFRRVGMAPFRAALHGEDRNAA